LYKLTPTDLAVKRHTTLMFYVDIKEYFMQIQIQSSKISDTYSDDYE